MNCLKLAAVIVLVFAQTASSEEPLITDVNAIAKDNNEFATDLYTRLSSDKSTNLFFSPYSISTALAMTYAGAEGQTGAEMAKVLHFTLPESKLHPAFNSLRELLNASDNKPGFQLRVNNRLWGQQGFHFQPEFLQVTKTNYGADLGLLDFQQTETARKSINSWVEDQTENKIKDLLAPGVLQQSTRLVLTNAIYFKARWINEFSKSATTEDAFHTTSSKQINVPTMHKTGRHGYVGLDDVQILELPYVGSGGISMLILLPTKVEGLSDLERRLTSENLQKWSAALHSRKVKVHLPKFKMTSEFSLGNVLNSMGMSLAFSRTADFSRMSSQEKLFISAVIHKAFVDVNEEGTEAAAATAVAMRAGSAPPRDEPVEFRADHPFVFLIRDNRTQSILFLGRVVNPKS